MWVRNSDLDAAAEAPLPIPDRIASNEEFIPPPQSPQQKEYAARLAAMSEAAARRHGISRRAFLRSGRGMAAALIALNQVFGDCYDVRAEEADDPKVVEEKWPKDQFIFDVQTHHVDLSRNWYDNSPDGKVFRRMFRVIDPHHDFDARNEIWNRVHYVKEIFLDSDTTVALLSGLPSQDWNKNPLPPDQMAETKKYVNALAGSQRMLAHGIVRPQFGKKELDDMDRQVKELKIDSWKFYPCAELGVGTWRIDDEKVAYPFWERARKLGTKNLCFHKGLPLGAFNEKACIPDDIEKAAKDFPDLNFIIYHSGFRGFGPSSIGTGERMDDPRKDEAQEVPWVSDLLRMLRRNPEIKNVYLELGNTFHQTSMYAPTMCMHMLGQMLATVGPDRILWGTDSVWSGAPRGQIERFRRIKIRDDLMERYGYPPLTDAVREKVLGLNAAKQYGIDPNAKRNAIKADRLTSLREGYKDELEPSNTQYGWVWTGEDGEATVPVGG
jgi:predicted TIM-barrel fold metal-dependent hydrolase